MTKKAKLSKKKYEPELYVTPYLHIAYGLFPDRESLDEILEANDIPGYLFNTHNLGYAVTMRGEYYDNTENPAPKRYAFVYAEQMLNDANIDEARKLAFLAHEAYHIVAFMFDMMRDERPSEESIAYTLTEVTDNLFQSYFKWKEANSGEGNH